MFNATINKPFPGPLSKHITNPQLPIVGREFGHQGPHPLFFPSGLYLSLCEFLTLFSVSMATLFFHSLPSLPRHTFLNSGNSTTR